MQITRDDIVEALRNAMQEVGPGEEGMTVAELREKMGKGEEVVRRCIKALLAQGKAKVVTVRRTDMAGRITSVPGYRLLP